MNENQTQNRSNGGTIVAPEATPAVRRKLSTTAAELMAERQGQLPVWIRSPKSGPEHYVGFTRAKLYELSANARPVNGPVQLGYRHVSEILPSVFAQLVALRGGKAGL